MQKAIVLIFAIVSVSLALNARSPDFLEFVDWMKTHRVDIADNELEMRYNIWGAAKKRINSANFRQSEITYSLNAFSAMTKEEFLTHSAGVDAISGSFPEVSAFPVVKGTKPRNFDWSAQVAATVRDQSISGAGVAYAAISTIEGVYAAKNKKSIQLSEQQLVDCTDINGFPTQLFEYAKEGLQSNFDYPTVARAPQRFSCKMNADQVVSSVKDITVYCNPNSASCNETALSEVLFANGPLSACFDASMLQDYSSGVLVPVTERDCSRTRVNQCGTIVGYGVEGGVKYWKVQNSFGTQWGEKGFFRIARGISACGIDRIVSTVSI